MVGCSIKIMASLQSHFSYMYNRYTLYVKIKMSMSI